MPGAGASQSRPVSLLVRRCLTVSLILGTLPPPNLPFQLGTCLITLLKQNLKVYQSPSTWGFLPPKADFLSFFFFLWTLDGWEMAAVSHTWESLEQVLELQAGLPGPQHHGRGSQEASPCLQRHLLVMQNALINKPSADPSAPQECAWAGLGAITPLQAVEP